MKSRLKNRLRLASGLVGVSIVSASAAGHASVVGFDSRFGINTTSSPKFSAQPMRWIAAITQSNTLASGPLCSGFFYDNNTIATAGHCVWGSFSGGSNIWLTSQGSIEVSRAAYWGSTSYTKPYGSCTAGGAGYTVAANANWTSSLNVAYDYGAIRLNNNCTLPTDWFSFGTSPVTTAGATYVAGYPADLGAAAGFPWRLVKGQGQTLGSLSSPGRICHDVDTNPGESGSPIYQYPSGSSAKAYGVHTQGAGGMPGCSSTQNGGVRLDSGVQTELLGWRA
jgi:glutamyl endopeptidase